MGENPLPVKGNQAAKDIKNGYAWLDMRQAKAIWLKHNVREGDIKLNKVGKAHDNAFTTLHEGVLREIGQQKIKRSMKLLRNVMEILYNRLPHTKGENISMCTKCK